MLGLDLDQKETTQRLQHFYRWAPEGRLHIPGGLLTPPHPPNHCSVDEGPCVEANHLYAAGSEAVLAAVAAEHTWECVPSSTSPGV